jgi:hypothetical protein
MLQSVATAVVMAGYAFLCFWKRPFLDRFEFFLEVALAECTLGSSPLCSFDLGFSGIPAFCSGASLFLWNSLFRLWGLQPQSSLLT